MSSSRKGLEEAQENLMKALQYFAAAMVLGGAIKVKLNLLRDHFYVDKFTEAEKKAHLFDSILFLVLGGLVLFFLGGSVHWVFYFLIWPIYYYFCFAVGLYVVPSLYSDKVSKRLTEKLTRVKIDDFSALEKDLLSSSKSPIGISLTTKKPVLIESRSRTEHLMITGATGERKSSAAIALRLSDYINGRAVIDVDPKGDLEDIETIKKYIKLYDREDDLYHFNISDPLNSWGYDPLELGSKRSKVDKIIYALDLSHEHFAGIAEDILSLIFDVADALGESISLYDLSRFLISKEMLFNFYEKVHDIKEKEVREDLLFRITATKSLRAEDLKGIKSKLTSLGSSDLKILFSPQNDKKINLKEVVENNRIAYFQLNTLEFKKLNRIIARFIMSDLGIIASQKSSGLICNDKDFVAFYLEEALSFIDKSFPEFLRMIRSAKIAMTIIFQNLAKLDTDFGPSFKSELLADTKTSMHFASSTDVDAESLTLLPGTIQTKSRSFALDNMEMFGYSGRGTEFEKTEKKVDSNMLRVLKKGQCLFFDKANKHYDIIASWSAKAPGFELKSKQYLRQKYFKKKKPDLVAPLYWSEKELLIAQVPPRKWHEVLTYEEIEIAKQVRLEWQNSHIH